MAGFAVVMTVLTYGFWLLVTACIVSFVLHRLSRQTIWLAGLRQHPLSRNAAAAPFLALLWLVCALLIHVQISNRLAHQDCGLSGDPYVTLPNGYVLGSLNTYSGYIVAPAHTTAVPATGPGYVRSLIDIRWENPYFRGTYDDMQGHSHRFAFDTRNQHISTIEDGPIDFEGTQNRVHSDADSYWTLYEHYRHRWPHFVLLILLIAGEAGIPFWLWKIWHQPELLPKEKP